MRAPRKLRIGALTYQLAADETVARASSADGVTIPSLGLIVLRPGMAADRERETVLHEVMHACWDQTALVSKGSDEEEQIVATLSPLLFGFLRSNPRAVSYLLDKEAS